LHVVGVEVHGNLRVPEPERAEIYEVPKYENDAITELNFDSTI
jgi:hypothetical protein